MYAVVEGAATEYDYLCYLNQEFGLERRFHIKVTADTRAGLAPSQALARARLLADDSDGESVWLLFDRDDNDAAELARVLDADSHPPDLRIAFSHPCFELWLYLHFKSAPGPQGGARRSLYSALRTAHPAYQNYDTNGGNKHLDEHRLEVLRGREADAVKRAARLVAECGDGRCDHNFRKQCAPLDRDPSTGVYLLLEHLGIVERT